MTNRQTDRWTVATNTHRQRMADVRAEGQIGSKVESQSFNYPSRIDEVLIDLHYSRCCTG